MDELVQFLRDRLDEDERIAQSAASVRGPDWWFEGYCEDMEGQVLAGKALEGGSSAVRSLAMTTRSDAEGEHAAHHDPARVLRNVEARRALLSRYEAMAAGVLVMIGSESILAEYRRVILPSLAAVYADHPDYRAEWRPDGGQPAAPQRREPQRQAPRPSVEDPEVLPMAPGCEHWRREHRADLCPMGACQRCRHLERL